MYYDKILNYATSVSENELLEEKEKVRLINETQERFVEVANVSDVIINVKLGVTKYEKQEEYDKKINSAISSVKRLDDMYKQYFNAELFESIPRDAYEVFELSGKICKEILEEMRNG